MAVGLLHTGFVGVEGTAGYSLAAAAEVDHSRLLGRTARLVDCSRS